MCYWTDKYPEGSEHWLLGMCRVAHPGDHRPLVFEKQAGEWAHTDMLEALEPDAIPLDVLIREVGPDKVMAALEAYLGVPKNKPSVHWTTLKVGDKVELDATALPDDDERSWIERTKGPYVVKELEETSYSYKRPLLLMDKTSGEDFWIDIDGIVGVHN